MLQIGIFVLYIYLLSKEPSESGRILSKGSSESGQILLKEPSEPSYHYQRNSMNHINNYKLPKELSEPGYHQRNQ